MWYLISLLSNSASVSIVGGFNEHIRRPVIGTHYYTTPEAFSTPVAIPWTSETPITWSPVKTSSFSTHPFMPSHHHCTQSSSASSLSLTAASWKATFSLIWLRFPPVDQSVRVFGFRQKKLALASCSRKGTS